MGFNQYSNHAPEPLSPNIVQHATFRWCFTQIWQNANRPAFLAKQYQSYSKTRKNGILQMSAFVNLQNTTFIYSEIVSNVKIPMRNRLPNRMWIHTTWSCSTFPTVPSSISAWIRYDLRSEIACFSFCASKRRVFLQQPSMTFASFVGSVGGHVGLFLGASIISCFKFFIIAAPLVYSWVKSLRKWSFMQILVIYSSFRV